MHLYTSGAQVHQGFYQAWTAIKSNVVSAVGVARTSCGTCNTLLVVGHSLGGALATLAAFELTGTLAGFTSLKSFTP